MRVIPRQLKRVIRSICACAGFLQVILAYIALGSEAAFALDPKKAITQYVHNAWTTEDGLPQNSILSIAQTRDGYLWVGTWGGLARFDGVRFTVFDRGNTPALKNNYIYALYEDSEGSLFTTKEGLSSNWVYSVYEGREGSIWVGTTAGLNCFKDGNNTVRINVK
jgi:ligand-binding sensor domain-containing protein